MLVSARAEGISIRTLAAAAGLSPSRVHQLVAAAGLDALDEALGELRAAGWPAPETPAAMRTLTWTAAITSPAACRTRRAGCGGARAGSGSPARAATRRRSTCARPPTGRTGPSWPPAWRVAAVIDRFAADVDELARARRAGDLDTAAVLPGRRAERRRRLAEPDLEFRAFCARRGLPASSSL